MPIFTPDLRSRRRRQPPRAPPRRRCPRLACSPARARSRRPRGRTASPRSAMAEPGDRAAEAEAQHGAAEHVGRVVHAEVGAADADRRREPEQVRPGPGLDAAERGGRGDRGRGVRGGERELRRRPGQRRDAPRSAAAARPTASLTAKLTPTAAGPTTPRRAATGRGGRSSIEAPTAPIAAQTAAYSPAMPERAHHDLDGLLVAARAQQPRSTAWSASPSTRSTGMAPRAGRAAAEPLVRARTRRFACVPRTDRRIGGAQSSRRSSVVAVSLTRWAGPRRASGPGRSRPSARDRARTPRAARRRSARPRRTA